MAHPGYSKEELSALRGIFALYDPDGSGAISVRELEGLLQKIGHSTDSASEILKAADSAAGGKPDGVITFDEFLELLQKGQPDQPGEQPDPKVMEFLRILEEYRRKCEAEGNYLEAGRAHQQLETLRKQEEKRQQKAVRARQIAERQDVQIAHNMQYTDFNAAWDKYLEEYDRCERVNDTVEREDHTCARRTANQHVAISKADRLRRRRCSVSRARVQSAVVFARRALASIPRRSKVALHACIRAHCILQLGLTQTRDGFLLACRMVS